MIFVRESESTLRGIKVANALRARSESGRQDEQQERQGFRSLPTLLANAEELVRFPSDDTAGQSAPTPFHDAAYDLPTISSASP